MKLTKQLQHQTTRKVCRKGQLHFTHSLSVVGSVSVEGESVCGMHHLDLKHQRMIAGSVEVGFVFFTNKVRIYCIDRQILRMREKSEQRERKEAEKQRREEREECPQEETWQKEDGMSKQ